MEKKPDLSIIIVNYNTRRLLKQCLLSLISSNIIRIDSNKNSQKFENCETIVVDNASTDGSVEMVEKEFPQVKLIKNKKNLGYAKANNQGLRRAQGEYILFLNSDSIVPKKTIAAVLAYLEKHPKVGVITPRLELRTGLLDPDCHRGFPTPWAALCYFAGLEKLFPRSKIFGQYHQTWKNLKMIHEIDACCGAFLLTRKKILAAVGALDESYFFYGEDLDFCYRVKQKGWKIVYFPKVKAIHYKGASSGLRSESADVVQVDPATRLKVARASTEAMRNFYNKFYREKYPFWVTALVLFGIKIKYYLRTLATSNNRTKKNPA